MQTVIETPAYLSAAKAAGLSEAELARIVDAISENPKMGEDLGGGLFKARIAGRSKGKSGGYRTITFYSDSRYPAFLLTVFGKGEKSNLTAAELAELKKLASILIASLKVKFSKLRAVK